MNQQEYERREASARTGSIRSWATSPDDEPPPSPQEQQEFMREVDAQVRADRRRRREAGLLSEVEEDEEDEEDGEPAYSLWQRRDNAPWQLMHAGTREECDAEEARLLRERVGPGRIALLVKAGEDEPGEDDRPDLTWEAGD